MLSANTLTIVYENYNLKIGKTPLILLKEILRTHWIFIITAGLGVVVVSMFLTHRFAGPMYRFEKSFEEMIKGNFNFQVRLREKDEGKELAEMMNQFISMISLNVKEMRHLIDEINRNLTDASTSVSKIEQGKEAAIKLDKANALTRRLRDILYTFKIKNDV